MAIYSYFYDSVDGDRQYSAGDFARAFGIFTENGVLKREENDGALGFDIGGTNYTTIYEGRAIIEGHFVEITDTETLVVPAGTYDGMVALQVDADGDRAATLEVITDRTPTQSASLYQLKLYHVRVNDGIITDADDQRTQGGAIPNNHSQPISSIDGLQEHVDQTVVWDAETTGARARVGTYAGTGKPIYLYLTSGEPSASASEHRVWIQIDNF
jgi:hypothetical protein